MSTIAENLQKLVDDRDNIAEAIAGKGVEVPENSKLSEFPEMINSISGGGGTAVPSDVVAGKTFSSDAGTELVGTMASYTDEEIVVGEPEIETKKEFNKFVTVGYGGMVMYSLDGVAWINALRSSSVSLYGVAYGKGKYATVGYYSSYGRAWYSLDGITWTSATLGNTNLGKISYGDGKFIAPLQSTTWYSLDGITWTSSANNLSQSLYGRDGYGITYGKDKFVYVGISGRTYYSINGTSWTALSGLNTNTAFYGVTYANGKFVCVGEKGRTYYIDDSNIAQSAMWTALSGTDSSDVMRGVTYGNGRFVASGYYTYYLLDGSTEWTAMSGAVGDSKYGVAYGNDKFVCVTNGGTLYYSTDGETWIEAATISASMVDVVAGMIETEYCSYTIPEGYHSSQKILLKK